MRQTSAVCLLLLAAPLLLQPARGFVPLVAAPLPRTGVPSLLPRCAAGSHHDGEETRGEVIKSFASVAGTFTVVAAGAAAARPAPANAVSADDVDPDKPQTVADYLKDIDGYNLPVPEFPKTLEWVNSGGLSFKKDLRGKIVLLDFWCYCCVNCQHTLPVLQKLEERYAGKPFQVIGVSATVLSSVDAYVCARASMLCLLPASLLSLSR